MNSKRTFFVMSGLMVVLVAAIISTTYLANGQLQKQSAKLVGYKTDSQVLSVEQVGLAKTKKDVAKYRSLETIARTIVPQDKDQAEAVREIVNIAAASGTQLTNINFPASTLGSNVKGAGAASGAPADGTAGSGASNAKSLSQLVPVKGITGVYSLPITIQDDTQSPVPYNKFLDFLSQLEQNRRTAQVTSIVIRPSATDRNLVSFTLTVDEFIKP